jgi:hypothetical protein
MAAPVTPLKATAGPPNLEAGDAASLLMACEARVRHAADRLQACAGEIRALRETVGQMRKENEAHAVGDR